MPSLTVELSQKTKTNYVFEQTFKHSLKFEPLLPLFSGLNSKFDFVTTYILYWSLLRQNFVLKSYLYLTLSRKLKTFMGSARPLDQEGLTL